MLNIVQFVLMFYLCWSEKNPKSILYDDLS